jgi:hypothetical protein
VCILLTQISFEQQRREKKGVRPSDARHYLHLLTCQHALIACVQTSDIPHQNTHSPPVSRSSTSSTNSTTLLHISSKTLTLTYLVQTSDSWTQTPPSHKTQLDICALALIHHTSTSNHTLHQHTANMVKWENDKNAYILGAALGASNVTISNEIAETIRAGWREFLIFFSTLPSPFLPLSCLVASVTPFRLLSSTHIFLVTPCYPTFLFHPPLLFCLSFSCLSRLVSLSLIIHFLSLFTCCSSFSHHSQSRTQLTSLHPQHPL